MKGRWLSRRKKNRRHCKKKHVLPDVIGSNLKFPKAVVILGPGPLGTPYWKFTSDFYVVAVNGAINIPVRKDVWLVGDSNASETDWFREGLKTYDCMRIFSYRLYRKVGPKVSANYGFHCVNQVDELYVRDPKRFRLTEGIPGVAMDMLTRFGTERIFLIGIDQAGSEYFDGSFARNSNEGDAHLHCRRVAKAIEMVKKDGIVVASISPTKLPNCIDGIGKGMNQGII